MGQKKNLFFKYAQEREENQLSSFGGVPVFLDFLKTIDLDRIVDSIFPQKSNQGYHTFQYLLGLILINITGGESVSDIEFLEQDNGLKRIMTSMESKFFGLKKRVFRKKRTRVFPSQSRILGFLDKFNAENEKEERNSTPQGKSKILPTSEYYNNLLELNQSVVRISQKINPSRTATLDMDNTLIFSQKNEAEHSYKGKAYHPFNVYWEEQGTMLYSEFRDGNVPAGKEQLRIFQEAEKHLPSGIRKLQVRSDTAGYQHEFLEYLDSGSSRFDCILFSVSCDVTPAFRTEVRNVPEANWEKVIITDKKGNQIETNQEVAEVVYTTDSSRYNKNASAFRYFATREKVDIEVEKEEDGQLSYLTSFEVEKKLHLEEFHGKAYKVFGYVTNRSETPLEILLWSRKRCGRSEQAHARLKGDLAGGRLPSGSFGENAAWWQISLLSFNLLQLFQRKVLPKEYHYPRMKKLRQVFFNVVVKVVKHSGSLVIKVGKKLKLFDLIQEIQQNLIRFDEILNKKPAPT